ncbi:MAG TPA: DUF2934 domain-containing protein [Burkholderiaceae bacterium]|nr:DUF2934 domain-containing protein [Burkholderiaceae bacterium]
MDENGKSTGKRGSSKVPEMRSHAGEGNGSDSPQARQGARPTPEERHQMISRIAYFRAEVRGWAPGGEIDDWLAAEREFEQALQRLEDQINAPAASAAGGNRSGAGGGNAPPAAGQRESAAEAPEKARRKTPAARKGAAADSGGAGDRSGSTAARPDKTAAAPEPNAPARRRSAARKS